MGVVVACHTSGATNTGDDGRMDGKIRKDYRHRFVWIMLISQPMGEV